MLPKIDRVRKEDAERPQRDINVLTNSKEQIHKNCFTSLEQNKSTLSHTFSGVDSARRKDVVRHLSCPELTRPATERFPQTHGGETSLAGFIYFVAPCF